MTAVTGDVESAVRDAAQLQSSAAFTSLATSGGERSSDADTEPWVDPRLQLGSSSWQTVALITSSVAVLVLVAAIAVVGVWKLCQSATTAAGMLQNWLLPK